MRHILLAWLTLPLLAACGGSGSIGGIPTRPPDFAADSTKSVSALGGCISETWIDLRMTVDSQLREGGVAVYVPGTPRPFVANIEERADGSHLELWMIKSLFPKLNAKILNQTKACV